MNILKLLVLPVLLVASVVSAEQARLQVRFNDADKNLERVVELSDGVQVFINADETRKVECIKDGDTHRLEVSVKNEAGEWELVADPKVRKLIVSIHDLTVTIEKIAE